MAIAITQTDTAGVAAQACNARTVTGATSREAIPGGTAGSTGVNTGNQNNGTHLTKVAFSWTPDSGTTWGAGTWTVRLNVTTGNTNLTIEDICIRRLNSSDVDQGSIGQLTAQGTSASAGVKTWNVTGAAQTPSAGDKVLITLTVSNASGQMNQQFSWTPNQDIDTPLSAAEITGSFSATLGDVTVAATGAVEVRGSLGATLGDVTLSAAGTVGSTPVEGTLAQTIGDVTLAATGAVEVRGSATPTLGDATLAATGAVEVRGSASPTLADVALTAAGMVEIEAQVDALLADVLLSASGVVGTPPIVGTLDALLGDAALVAAGAVAVAGALDAVLADVSLSAAGGPSGGPPIEAIIIRHAPGRETAFTPAQGRKRTFSRGGG